MLGDSGSGKSSAILYEAGVTSLRAGASVIYTTVKPNDAANAVMDAKSEGRVPRAFTVGADTFNPLGYAQACGADIESLVQLATLPMRRASYGRGADRFWEQNATRYVRSVIGVLSLAQTSISYLRISEALVDLPHTPEAAHDPNWQQNSVLYKAIQTADHLCREPRDRRDLERFARQVLVEAPMEADKTRSSTISTYVASVDPLLTGGIGETLNAETDTWDPRQVVDRPGVLVLDAPVQRDDETGRTVQRIIVSSIQKAVLRSGASSHPIVFICDEYPSLVDPVDDPAFMRTARDRGGFMVTAAQTVSAMVTACGATTEPRAAAHELLGLPALKIFACQTDPETLRFISDVFSETYQNRVSLGESKSDQPGRPRANRSVNISSERAPEVMPADIASLRRGGPENKYAVDAFVSLSGRVWSSSGRRSLKARFTQRPDAPSRTRRR